MRSVAGLVLMCIAIFSVNCAEQSSRGPNKLHREATDIFKIFVSFEHPIAITDIDNDSSLDCLSARRTAYDPESHTATYVWSLGSSNGSKSRQHFTFNFKEGDTPGTAMFTVGTDDTVEVARFRYTDYKTCAILEVPHFGDQCTLWVNEGFEDSIPEDCLEQFADICGNGVTHHDADMCKDVD